MADRARHFGKFGGRPTLMALGEQDDLRRQQDDGQQRNANPRGAAMLGEKACRADADRCEQRQSIMVEIAAKHQYAERRDDRPADEPATQCLGVVARR